MNQKFTILQIVILLLEYPLLLLKGELKKAYSKKLKKKIQNLKNLIQKNQDLVTIIEALDEAQKILKNFIVTNQNEISEDHQLFLEELNKCLLVVKENLFSENSSVFYKLSFNFVLENLKQNNNLNTSLQQSKKDAHVWENKAYEASQYSSGLNRELEHIAGDIINLLKTIKTLKAKLTLEESRREILTEEKKALTEELAIEKEKK